MRIVAPGSRCNLPFHLSASDLVIITDCDLFRKQPSAQGAVFCCISSLRTDSYLEGQAQQKFGAKRRGGSDYRRLGYYCR